MSRITLYTVPFLTAPGRRCKQPVAMLTTRKGGLEFPFFIRRITVLSSFAALFFLCGCAETGPEALENGARLIDEGKFDEAISKLTKSIELLPKNAQAWNHLGLAHHYAGNAAKAEQA